MQSQKRVLLPFPYGSINDFLSRATFLTYPLPAVSFQSFDATASFLIPQVPLLSRFREFRLLSFLNDSYFLAIPWRAGRPLFRSVMSSCRPTGQTDPSGVSSFNPLCLVFLLLGGIVNVFFMGRPPCISLFNYSVAVLVTFRSVPLF